MPPQIALIAFIMLIASLFWLDRDPEDRVSKALIIPFVWMIGTSSRSLGEWWQIVQTGHPVQQDQATMYLEGNAVDRNILIVLMVLALIVLIRRGRLVPILRVNLPIVAFLAFAFLSVFWSDFSDVTIRRWFKCFGCVLMVMVVLSERNREAAVRRLLVSLGFLLIPLSVMCIKYYPAIGRTYNRWTWLVSSVGVTTHKNSLGGICQVFGLAFVWHFLRAYRNRKDPNRKKHLLAHGIVLAMVVWLFIQANSVTAQSSFLLASALLFVASTKTVAKKPGLVHLLTWVLMAIPFATLFLGIGSSALNNLGRDSTLTGRTDIWARVISLVHNPVLGTGFESFWLGDRLQAMNDYQLGLNEAHNGFIEIWANLGYIGVVLLAVLLIRSYMEISSSLRENPGEGTFRMAFFLTVMVSSFTEAAFRTESIAWMVFLLIGLHVPKQWDDKLPRQVKKEKKELNFNRRKLVLGPRVGSTDKEITHIHTNTFHNPAGNTAHSWNPLR